MYSKHKYSQSLESIDLVFTPPFALTKFSRKRQALKYILLRDKESMIGLLKYK